MGGCGGWIEQETVTGLPKYRLQTPLHRSDRTDCNTAMSYDSLLLHIHTHTQSRWRPDPFHLHFSSDFPGWQQCLTSLSGLEWGPRHLGPNQSFRTNAGRGRRAGPCSLYCVHWRPARHAAVLLKLCDRTWEVKARWLTNHMLKQFVHFESGIIVGPLVLPCYRRVSCMFNGDQVQFRNEWKSNYSMFSSLLWSRRHMFNILS